MSEELEFEDVTPIGGMIPWLCSYDNDGSRFSITLYGTDPQQVLENNCSSLSGLTVDGQLMMVSKPIEGKR